MPCSWRGIGPGVLWLTTAMQMFVYILLVVTKYESFSLYRLTGRDPNSVTLLTGPEHQELQVATLADTAQLPVPASPAPHRHTAAEQSDGALVSHALPHAPSVRLASRVQGVVRQPADGHDRRKQRVQRESHQTATQSEYGWHVVRFIKV